MSQAWRVVRSMKTTSRAHHVHGILSALAITMASGCSAVLNMDADQCQVDMDCIDRFGTSQPFLCIDNVCERPLCGTDSDCRSRGGTFEHSICDANDGRCAAGECLDSTNCVLGQACDTSTNRCVASNCQTTEQCFTNNGNALASPTVQCVGGLCVDPTWGCIGAGDNRPPSTSDTATLKVSFIDGTTGRPAAVPLSVRACSLPAFDPNCNAPISTDVTYDTATGMATLSGLPARTPLRVKMDPPEGEADIVPIDFYTPRTPVGVTEAPPIRLVYRSKLAELVAALGGSAATIDPTYGSFYGMFFDCQDKPAAFMKLSILEQGTNPPLILYFDENNYPHLEGLEHTTSTGMFSTLNVRPTMPVNVTTTLVATLGSMTVNRMVNKYLVTALPARLTTVHFYPRDYAKTQ